MSEDSNTSLLFTEAEVTALCRATAKKAFKRGQRAVLVPLRALSRLNGDGATFLKAFEEQKHPRDHGRFSNKPGASGESDEESESPTVKVTSDEYAHSDRAKWAEKHSQMAVKKMHEAGFDLPPDIQVRITSKENPGDVLMKNTPDAFATFNGFDVVLDGTRDWHSNERQFSQLQTGFTSKAKWGIIAHEFGHALHRKAVREQGISDADSYRTWSAGKAAAEKVSLYATTNAEEFVAETFAGICSGNEYPPDVMALYQKLGGPMPQVRKAFQESKHKRNHGKFARTSGSGKRNGNTHDDTEPVAGNAVASSGAVENVTIAQIHPESSRIVPNRPQPIPDDYLTAGLEAHVAPGLLPQIAEKVKRVGQKVYARLVLATPAILKFQRVFTTLGDDLDDLKMFGYQPSLSGVAGHGTPDALRDATGVGGTLGARLASHVFAKVVTWLKKGAAVGKALDDSTSDPIATLADALADVFGMLADEFGGVAPDAETVAGVLRGMQPVAKSKDATGHEHKESGPGGGQFTSGGGGGGGKESGGSESGGSRESSESAPKGKHEVLKELYDRSMDPTLTTKQFGDRLNAVMEGMSQKERDEAGEHFGLRTKPVSKENLRARVIGRRASYLRANDGGAFDEKWTVQSAAAELKAGEITPEQAEDQIRRSIGRTNLSDTRLIAMAHHAGVPEDVVAAAEEVAKRGPLVARGDKGKQLRTQLENAVHANLMGEVNTLAGHDAVVKAWSEEDAMLVGLIRKAGWSADLHPRDDSGRFIDAHDLHAATTDPAKAAELRAKVTKPEERKKLDEAIGAEEKPQAEAKPTTVEEHNQQLNANGKRLDEIRHELIGMPSGEEKQRLRDEQQQLITSNKESLNEIDRLEGRQHIHTRLDGSVVMVAAGAKPFEKPTVTPVEQPATQPPATATKPVPKPAPKQERPETKRGAVGFGYGGGQTLVPMDQSRQDLVTAVHENRHDRQQLTRLFGGDEEKVKRFYQYAMGGMAIPSIVARVMGWEAEAEAAAKQPPPPTPLPPSEPAPTPPASAPLPKRAPRKRFTAAEREAASREMDAIAAAERAKRVGSAASPTLNLSDGQAISAAVQEAASQSPAWNGDAIDPSSPYPHKVYISHVYEQLKSRLPAGTTLDEFKRALESHNRSGHVKLSPIDMPQASADARAHAESEAFGDTRAVEVSQKSASNLPPPVATKPASPAARKPKNEAPAAKASRLLTPPQDADPSVAAAFARIRAPFEGDGAAHETSQSVAARVSSAWMQHAKAGNNSITSALEPVLTGLGAERHGELGETVPFNGRVHESESGVSTGQPVKVIRHGWQMTGDTGPPLLRTLVVPV